MVHGKKPVPGNHGAGGYDSGYPPDTDREGAGGIKVYAPAALGAFENAFPPGKDTWQSHGLPEKGVMPMPKRYLHKIQHFICPFWQP